MRTRPFGNDDDHLDDIKRHAYEQVCPFMNRAERRTARGQLQHMRGEMAALRAENEYLKEKLKGL